MALGEVIILDDVEVKISAARTNALASVVLNLNTERVRSFRVLQGGVGYDPDNLPAVVVDGDGTGAMATAVVDADTTAVTGITVDAAGSDYTRATVSIEDSPVGTDLGAGVAMARLHITHASVDVPHTMKRRYAPTVVSPNYRWMIELEFQTDGYDADEIDDLIGSYLPLYESTATGICGLRLYPLDDAAADARAYRGDVSLAEWEPLGSDTTAAEAIVQQTRTFNGIGTLYVDN